MPVAEALDAPVGTNPRRAVPGHFGMPIFFKLHDFRAAALRMFAHVGQHIENMFYAGIGLRLVVRGGDDAVLRRRAGNEPFHAQAGRHRPGVGLHHELGNVPNGLHFDDLVAFDAEEFGVAHEDGVLGGGDVRETAVPSPPHNAPHSQPSWPRQTRQPSQ